MHSLTEVLESTPWLMQAMRAVRTLKIPEAYIGSGAIRNAVWDALHDYSKPSFLADVDVPYLDPDDMSEATEEDYENQLRELEPELPWDVKNQAAVHLWFHRVFGHSVEPLRSIEDAAASWPETALAVAVRLEADDTIEVIAPLGLGDLFSMVVRRNPRRVSVETYEERIKKKRYTDRWPMVRVIHE